MEVAAIQPIQVSTIAMRGKWNGHLGFISHPSFLKRSRCLRSTSKDTRRLDYPKESWRRLLYGLQAIAGSVQDYSTISLLGSKYANFRSRIAVATAKDNVCFCREPT